MQRATNTNTGSRSPDAPSRKSAAELDRDARSQAEKLKGILAAQPPWSREVEQCRQRCRKTHLTILFSYPLSSHAQSLDTLWHHTSYLLIAAYRELIANIERSLSPPPSSTTNSGAGKSRRSASQQQSQGQGAGEMKKAVTRFRQALSSEETFYKSLISRLVKFYGLADVGDTASYLREAKIPLVDNTNSAKHSNDNDDSNDDVPRPSNTDSGTFAASSTAQEKRDKLALVFKGLICLGDLERYKEQYKEPTKSRRRDKEGNGKRATQPEERFGEAKRYYEIARALQPDDGSAFNQLAVISTYQSNDFSTAYYYFRALAIRNAFKGAEGILYKFLLKSVERWRAKRREGGRGDEEAQEEDEQVERRDVVGTWKDEFIVLIGILYHKAGFSFIPALQPSLLDTLFELLKSRRLSAEVIVQTTVIVIGSHYRARSTSGTEQDPKLVQRSYDTETKALDLLLGTAEVLMRVGAEEVEEARSTLGDESALAVDDEEDIEDQLPRFISAVLRRILPSLRIMSKWVKLDLEYLARRPTSPVITSFWTTYKRLIDAISTVFPITRLPSLPEPLEEDIDMKGFLPLQRGITAEGGVSNGSSNSLDGLNAQGEVHPNEEQLMRLADLQVDAKLIMQSGVGAALLGGPNELSMPTSFEAPREREIDEADLASVSTETDDDPVNLAMRATLGAESSAGDEDELDEVILWNPSQNQQSAPPAVVAPGTQQPPSTKKPKKPTAYDLLQNLMLDSTPSPPALPPAIPHLPPASSSPGLASTPDARHLHQPSSSGIGAGAGGLLFGSGAGASTGQNGMQAGGGSIWTMTREESEKGQKRASVGNIASIWGNPPPGSEATSAPSPLTVPYPQGNPPLSQPHHTQVNSQTPSPAHASYPPQTRTPVQYNQFAYQSQPLHQSSPQAQYPPHQQAAPQQHLNSHVGGIWGASTVPPPLPIQTSSPSYPYGYSYAYGQAQSRPQSQTQPQSQIPYYAQPAYYAKSAMAPGYDAWASASGADSGPGFSSGAGAGPGGTGFSRPP